MARRSGFSPRRTSSGVARDWGQGPGGSNPTAVSATGQTILGAGISTTGSELTLLRTRGILSWVMTGPPGSDGDGYFGAVGIGVVSEQAFVAGVASIPSPVDESQWNGWLWHQYMEIHATDISLGTGGLFHRVEVDSKAMRKFDASVVLVAVQEVTEIGAASMNVFFDTRILFQDSGR